MTATLLTRPTDQITDALLPRSEYVAHTPPACVAPFLYVRAAITRQVEEGRMSYTVWFVWSKTDGGLDRPLGHGISTGGNLRLAQRLATATMAGALFTKGAELLTDINGQTYVSAPSGVMGRYLNADLTRLGF